MFAFSCYRTGASFSSVDVVCAHVCSLSKKKTAEKKVAITVFSFPPDKGNVGTAAYLNVFGSIYRVLQDLKAQGYTVDGVPEKEEDLIKSVSSWHTFWQCAHCACCACFAFKFSLKAPGCAFDDVPEREADLANPGVACANVPWLQIQLRGYCQVTLCLMKPVNSHS